MKNFNLWLRETYFPQCVMLTVLMIVTVSAAIAFDGKESVITFPKLVAVIVGISLVSGSIIPFLIKGIELFFDGLFALINLIFRKFKNQEKPNDR